MFLALFRSNNWWIARMDAPLKELVRFSHDVRLQRLTSYAGRLHVFVRGAPESKDRPDKWYTLKHYEYELLGDKPRLVTVQDFDFTWQIFDFDADSRMMVVRSWDDMFAHAWLVDTRTGARKQIGPVRGNDGLFLKEPVFERFRTP